MFNPILYCWLRSYIFLIVLGFSWSGFVQLTEFDCFIGSVRVELVWVKFSISSYVRIGNQFKFIGCIGVQLVVYACSSLFFSPHYFIYYWSHLLQSKLSYYCGDNVIIIITLESYMPLCVVVFTADYESSLTQCIIDY